ncbi:MAG TPA: YkvA family protein [Caulobacteraceae bacterium]|nr:YkvA family protein [Caulobacteraceae bacterium]
MSTANAKPMEGEAFAAADPLAPIDRSRALVPAVQRVNEIRVRRGFWPKLKRLAPRIPFAADVVSLYYCAMDDQTPRAAKAIILAALVWFISPFSIVQDLMAGIGFVSDAAVIAAVIGVVGANLKPRHREQAKAALKRLAES